MNAKFQKNDLNQSVARILLNDEFADANVGAFATLDLSDNGKFKALEPGQKNMLLRVLARGARVEELALNNLGLDNRNAAALGEVLRGQEKLRSLSLDANALSGPGLKSLAADFKGHPTLSELSLDNQCNGAMMPNDAARLIVEATEATPALIVLKLGHLRDSGLRYRLQTALSAHTELVRQKRHRISMGEEGGSPSNVRQRRGSLGMRGRPGGQSVGAALADDASRLTPNLTARLAAVAPLVDAAILAASRRSQHSDDCAWALGELDRLLPFARARPAEWRFVAANTESAQSSVATSVAGTAPSSVVPSATASPVPHRVGHSRTGSEGGLPATAPSTPPAPTCPPAARRRRLAAGRFLAAGAPGEGSVVPVPRRRRGARGRGARGRRARGGGGAGRGGGGRGARARGGGGARGARARGGEGPRGAGVGGATEG